MFKRISFLLLFFVFAFDLDAFSTVADTTSFTMNSRLSFYSFEKSGEMILHIPQALIWKNLNIALKLDNKEITSWKGIPGKKILNLPYDLGIAPGLYKVIAEINSAKGTLYKAIAELVVLNSKPNEVKTEEYLSRSVSIVIRLSTLHFLKKR
jgi:hypothetical protein